MNDTARPLEPLVDDAEKGVICAVFHRFRTLFGIDSPLEKPNVLKATCRSLLVFSALHPIGWVLARKALGVHWDPVPLTVKIDIATR